MSDEIIVTLWLAPRDDTFSVGAARSLGATPVVVREYFSRSTLRERGDASPDVRGAAAADCLAAGATHVEHAWRRIAVHGSLAACTRAVAALRGGRLAHQIVAVFGLVSTAKAESYARVSADESPERLSAFDVARAYRMPPGLTGSGSAVGILHFDGTFHPADFELAMAAARVPVPRYVRHGREGSSTQDDDVEIALDTQIVGALAPGATLVIYRGSNDARGYAETVAEALLDEGDAPTILSISYGVPESAWPADAVRLIDQLFVAAALCGITIVAASGDHGAEVSEHEAQVIFPASSPFALACGGTNLRLERGRRVSEYVWSESERASGGGYSRIFERPAWQAADGRVRRRGVPDVAGHAATKPGYAVYLGGKPRTVGGTSAVAPLWAAFVALVNQRLGKPCGFFVPLLYGHPAAASFYDITTGSNGRYVARRGWDACTGLGSPHFGELLRAFTEAARA